jgi:hypothetical protein
MAENMNDMAIPEMKLVQALGGEEAKGFGAKAGDFYCSITQQVVPGAAGFQIVILRMPTKTRTYWGRTEIEDEPPTCGSSDGETSLNGDICKSACPFGAYNDNPGMVPADKRRALCTPSFNVVGVNTADMMPVMIRCSGISAGAARNLITLLTFHKDIKGKPYKVTLKVTAVTKKTPFGDSYAVAFGQPTPIADQAMLADLRGLTEQLTGIEIGPEIEKVADTVKQIANGGPVPIDPDLEKATPALQQVVMKRREEAAKEAAMTPEAKAVRAAQAEKDANLLFPPDPSNEAAKAKEKAAAAAKPAAPKMDF